MILKDTTNGRLIGGATTPQPSFGLTFRLESLERIKGFRSEATKAKDLEVMELGEVRLQLTKLVLVVGVVGFGAFLKLCEVFSSAKGNTDEAFNDIGGSVDIETSCHRSGDCEKEVVPSGNKSIRNS